MAKLGQGVNSQTAWLTRRGKRVPNTFTLFNAKQSATEAAPAVIKDWFFGTVASGLSVTSNKSYGAVTGTGTLTVLITVTSNKSYGAVTGTGSLTVLITVTSSKTYGAMAGTGTLTVLITLTSSKSFGAVTGTGTLAVSGGLTPTLPENVYIRSIQITGWRIAAQLRQTHIYPVKYRDYLQPQHDRDYMIPIQNTGYKANAHNRSFIILNPTDS